VAGDRRWHDFATGMKRARQRMFYPQPAQVIPWQSVENKSDIS
jgi:hypothetical protein